MGVPRGGQETARSDVDICVVAGEGRDATTALRAFLRVAPVEADVHVLEELPPILQGEVIEGHRLLWADDEGGLYEYLRPFWKRWRTQPVRNTLTREEALRIIRG